MSTLQTFLANVKFAARTGGPTTIGGGIYSAKEMREVAQTIEEVLEALQYITTGGENWTDCTRRARAAIAKATGAV